MRFLRGVSLVVSLFALACPIVPDDGVGEGGGEGEGEGEDLDVDTVLDAFCTEMEACEASTFDACVEGVSETIATLEGAGPTCAALVQDLLAFYDCASDLDCAALTAPEPPPRGAPCGDAYADVDEAIDAAGCFD